MAPFNSQPHTRLTRNPYRLYMVFGLSIHSLIRGWPRTRKSQYTHKNLSIHSLIRGWPFKIRWRIRIKIFQFTASYEADLYCPPCEKVYDDLSIHSLIRGWPMFFDNRNFKQFLSIHSLIRGWPCSEAVYDFRYHLSIHSLIRGWPIKRRKALWTLVFQFTASYEADQAESSRDNVSLNFQFTASYEADRTWCPWL